MHIDLKYFNAVVDDVVDVSESLIYDFDFKKCNFEPVPLLYMLSKDFFENSIMICDNRSLEPLGIVMSDKCIHTNLELSVLLALRVVHVYAGIVFVEYGGVENGR